MAEPPNTGEIVKRALDYPYEQPNGSFIQVGGQTLEAPAAGLDLSGRTPLLTYGSNAAPEALTRKLASLPTSELPVLRAELDDFDVVYSAHISPYGSVPATIQGSPGTSIAVHVAYPDDYQLPLLSMTEPNYEVVRLRDISCRLDGDVELTEIDLFLSRHGCLSIDGGETGLTATRAHGRDFAEMTQPQVLELARSHLAPELGLERFILDCVEAGGLAPLPALTTS